MPELRVGMNYNPPYIISDEPLKDNLGFGFDRYAQTLAEVVAHKKNSTPLVIGIYGSWGSGKTTLMHGIEAELNKFNCRFSERNWPGKDVYRPTKTVWFQAWKYAEEDAILAALIDEVLKAAQADGVFDHIKVQMELWAKTLNRKGVVSQLVSGFTGGALNLREIIPDPEHRKKLGFYSDFSQLLDGLIWAYVTATGIQDGREFDDKEGALVIFIDDLDRCPSPRVLKVLETIKLFLDKKGCVFILGAAQDVIENALQERYGKEDETKRFMDKIVQVTFSLPQPTVREISTFLEAKITEGTIPTSYQNLIGQSLKFNVRSVKRFLNNLALRQSLATKAEVDLGKHAQAMIPWTILELGHSAMAHLIRLSPQYVNAMQQATQNLEKQGIQIDQWLVNEEAFEQAKVLHPLRPFLINREIINLVSQLPSDIEVLRALIGLTATVGTIGQDESSRKDAGLRDGYMGLKDMVNISAGPFLYGQEKEWKEIKQAFLMDVYPVTNSQFRQFIEGGGYDQKTYWSEEGWEWKKKKMYSAPRFWNHEQWNALEYPVVGVSWFEAQAFARWAGKRLPTELEWERAASGEAGWQYPWGDHFDPERCNSTESKIGKTTPVTKYPEGRSPEGCFDMAGNVWEWTEDSYGMETKLLCGGSWYNGARNWRSTNRVRGRPVGRDDDVGFRCAKDVPKDGKK